MASSIWCVSSFGFSTFSLTSLSPSWRSLSLFFALSLSLGTFCIHVPYLSHFLSLAVPSKSRLPSPSLVHPIAHPIELGGCLDATVLDSLPKLSTVNRRRGYSHPFNSHLPTPVLHLSYSSTYKHSHLWTCNLLAHAPSRTSPHGCPFAPSASSPPTAHSINPSTHQTMTAHRGRIPAGRHRQNSPLPQQLQALLAVQRIWKQDEVTRADHLARARSPPPRRPLAPIHPQPCFHPRGSCGLGESCEHGLGIFALRTIDCWDAPTCHCGQPMAVELEGPRSLGTTQEGAMVCPGCPQLDEPRWQ